MIARRTLLGGAIAAGVTAGLEPRARGRSAAAAGDDADHAHADREHVPAPQYVAEELLRGEGFTDVRYIKKDGPHASADALAAGEADINMHFSGPVDPAHRRRRPRSTILAGVHPGCYELFATERVRTISDLKGKTVGIRGLAGSPSTSFSRVMARARRPGSAPGHQLGRRTRAQKSMRLLAEGKVDASWASRPTLRSCARRRSATWS